MRARVQGERGRAVALAHIHTSADAIVARADGRRASEGHGVQKAPRCDYVDGEANQPFASKLAPWALAQR